MRCMSFYVLIGCDATLVKTSPSNVWYVLMNQFRKRFMISKFESCKLFLALTKIIRIQWGHNLAYAVTALSLWPVQNIDVIGSLEWKSDQKYFFKISITSSKAVSIDDLVSPPDISAYCLLVRLPQHWELPWIHDHTHYQDQARSRSPRFRELLQVNIRHIESGVIGDL